MMPRFYRYLPGPRPTWRCLKSDLRSWGELWDIPPPLGSFAGLRSATLTTFLVLFFLSCMLVTFLAKRRKQRLPSRIYEKSYWNEF